MELDGIGSCVSLNENFWSSCSFAFGIAVAYYSIIRCFSTRKYHYLQIHNNTNGYPLVISTLLVKLRLLVERIIAVTHHAGYQCC